MLRVSRSSTTPLTEISFFPTPGATEGRWRMRARLLRAGAEAANRLTALLPYIEQDNALRATVPYLKNLDPTVDAVLRTLAGPDGFSLAGLHTGAATIALGDGSVRLVFQGLVGDVFEAIQVGVNNERWEELPGVALITVPTTAIFNLRDLAELTMQVADANVREALLGYLSLAQRAAASGDALGAAQQLDAYAELLQKVRGRLLPAVQADALAQIATSVK